MRELTEEEKEVVLALVSQSGLGPVVLAVAESWQAQADGLLLEASIGYDTEKQLAGTQWAEFAKELRGVVETHLAPFDEVISGG
jgi:hypothetical protein